MSLGFADTGEFVDLFIDEDGDIALSVDNTDSEPKRIEQRACIAQDIKHLILETGLLREMVGERDLEKRRLLLNRLEREIDEDVRLVAGTITITETEKSANDTTVWVVADTILYKTIGFAVVIDGGV